MRRLLLTLLAGCVSLPNLPPTSRTAPTRDHLTVKVISSCGEQNMMPEPGGDDAMPIYGYTTWRPDSSGTGVVVDDRHVLTAAHVVNCPIIPVVDAWFPQKRGWYYGPGAWMGLSEERNLTMFPHGGPKADLALLESWTAENFDTGAAPLIVGPVPHVGDPVCVVTLRGETCGTWDIDGWLDGVKTISGDSGAPAYDGQGRLVGIVRGVGPTSGRTKLEFERLAEAVR